MTWTEFKTKYRLYDIEAVDYIDALGIEDCNEIVRKLANNAKERWAILVLATLLDLKNSRILSIFCAELVLPIYEAHYPGDTRPRNAIKAAREYLENLVTSNAAARAAVYAADAATAAYAAAYAANAIAAYAAAYAANAARAAAYAAANAADAALAAMVASNFNPATIKAILDEGFRLLEEQNK